MKTCLDSKTMHHPAAVRCRIHRLAWQRMGSEEAEHPRHLGRRHRLLEHQRLQPGHDGLQDAEH